MKRMPTIQLVCPECNKTSEFPPAVLVAGMPLRCPRCGMESNLSHDRDTPDSPPVWRLESPDLGEDSP